MAIKIKDSTTGTDGPKEVTGAAVAMTTIDKTGLKPPGPVEVQTEQVGQMLTHTPHPHRVRYALGGTVPTQPYANIRFEVSLEVPCEEAQIDTVFSNAKDWVDDRATEIINEINEGTA